MFYFAINKYLDKITEILIYFMVIFSPWAFGTTENWSIWVMNVSSYALGAILLIRYLVNLSKSNFYYSSRQNKKLSLKHYRMRLNGKTCKYVFIGISFILLLYIYISATNARAIFDFSSKELLYLENYSTELPHSYDANATWKLFWKYLGLVILFISVSSWISNYDKIPRRHRNVNPRIKNIIILITINGGLVGTLSILQRIFYGEEIGKLLFLVVPSENYENIRQFGPYAYRSNASTYFNMVWPLALGLYLQLSNTYETRISNKTNVVVILIPFIIICIASPLISSARGGTFIMFSLICITLMILIIQSFLEKKKIFFLLMVLFIAILLGIKYGWENINQRINNVFTDNLNHRVQIYKTTIDLINIYTLSDVAPAPFGSGPGTFTTIAQFEIGEEGYRQWEAWVHNDYLETILTFGIPGSILIVILISIIIICVFRNIINGYSNIILFSFISFIGLSVHAAFDFPMQVYSILQLCIIISSIIISSQTNLRISSFSIPSNP